MRLFEDAMIYPNDEYYDELVYACLKVVEECDICASSERLKHMKKTDSGHVSEAFNKEVQDYFSVVKSEARKFKS